MARTIRVTEKEYRAIVQWDDDGGFQCDIDYEIIPDAQIEINIAVVECDPPSSATQIDDKVLEELLGVE